MALEHNNKDFFRRDGADKMKLSDIGRKRVVSGKSEPKVEIRGLESAFGHMIKYLSEEAHLLEILASKIDKEILDTITKLLKLTEPQINNWFRYLNELIDDYDLKSRKLEKLKLDYDECARLQDLKPKMEIYSDDESIDGEYGQSDSDTEVEIRQGIDDEKGLLNLNFPLIFGTVKVSSKSDLCTLLEKLYQSIPLVKKKIFLPGSKNEIFDSADLCKSLTKIRPFGLNPSAANLERFGQTLIDLRLIIPTSFWSKKFKKEDMWFEWSDMVLSVADSTIQSDEFEKPKRQEVKPSKFANDISTTTKRFNNMFQNVKTSFRKLSPEMMPEIELKYNEEYLELHETKSLIDIEITQRAQDLEKFEIKKIEIVYQSLAKLLEVLYNSSLAGTGKLHILVTDFIEKINLPANYKQDFDKLVEDFGTGIYFPSNISPESLINKQILANQANNSFQNIRSQFNLFTDIPLQLQSSASGDMDPSISSIPVFLYELVKLIEKGDSENFNKYWILPLDHQKFWEQKKKIIEAISSFEIQDKLEMSQEVQVHKQIIDMVLDLLKNESSADLIGFLKNWLLQTSDSLIPYMVYDQVIGIYNKPPQTKSDSDSPLSSHVELLKYLSPISRSNLSSLIYVLEHIAKSFNLELIDGYHTGQFSPLSESRDQKNVDTEVGELNSMKFIGTVPFIHLILRPSTSKSSTGLKPPMEAYNSLLSDLLQIETREKLFGLLLEHETRLKEKKERESLGLQIKKLPNPPKDKKLANNPSIGQDSTPSNTVIYSELQSPQPQTPEPFTLRPFRTKITPIPSPVTSPNNVKHYKAEDYENLNKQSLKTPTRSRLGSTGLKPSIAIEISKHSD